MTTTAPRNPITSTTPDATNETARTPRTSASRRRRASFTKALAAAALLGTMVGLAGPMAPASAAPKDCAYNPGGRGGLGTYVDKIGVDQRDWEIDVFDLINAYRAQNGLARLQFSRELARPAMWLSLDNYDHNTLTHTDSRGMRMRARVDFCSAYRGGYLGEIIYKGTGSLATPTAAVDAWKNSPPHNANMLNPNYKFMAVGMAYLGEDRRLAYYTVVFGDH